MAGPRLRRRFRVVLVAEGDTWEDAGEAATYAIMLLQKGDPEELDAASKPFEAMGTNPNDTHGWKVEISRDDRMTHDVYVDLKAKATAGGAAVAAGEVAGAPEGEAEDGG